MEIVPTIDGSDRYRGTLYRVRRGEAIDLPDGLARTYLRAGKGTRPDEAKVVAPAADTSKDPDEQTPQDTPDETPSETSEEDKGGDGVVVLGGGWYQLPDGTKQRGRP